MCCTGGTFCGRIWTSLTVLWSLIYVCAGAVQIVTGIFLIISLPDHALCSNVWAGAWNVVAGIGGGMIACFGAPSPRRQRRLLYVASSILIVNTINAVVTEYTFYMAGQGLLLPIISWTDFEEEDAEDDDVLLNGSREQHVRSLVANARVTAGVAATIILLAAFLDAQFSFCSIDSTKKSRHSKFSKSRGSHEQVSDIEYIIPRAKSNSEPKTSSSAVDAYAQSWVFETTEVNNHNNTGGSTAPSSYMSATAAADISDSSATTQLDSTLKLTNGHIQESLSPTLSTRIIPIIIPQVENTTAVFEASVIANPVVHIEEASDESTSNSNSDRKLCYMKSFSRTPSPVVLSAASSQMSLNYNHNPPIYECLEKLTESQVYRSRLNSALSAKDEPPQYASTVPVAHSSCSTTSPRKSDLPSPRQAEPVHYASLMVELQEAITSKKNNNITSPPQTISVSGSSKSESSQRTDAEFSKELEAALQLIQDLESPNTAETPSEPGRSAEGQRPLAVWRHSDASGSEKTLSAVGSLGELTSPLTEALPVLSPLTVTVHGKDSVGLPRRLVQCTSSQSTSGYSSPTRKLTPNNWSIASSTIDDNTHRHTTDLGRTLSFQIRNTNNSAVISLFPNPQLKNASINSRNSFCTSATGPKSVTVVKINSDHDNNNLDYLQLNSSTLDVANNNIPFPYDDKNQDLSYENSLTRSHKINVRRSTSMTASWNVMSLLRKKKHVPKLSPELESAIIKSESLAHLTDTELLARLEKNKQIQRQIELRVQQQMGQMTESNC